MPTVRLYTARAVSSPDDPRIRALLPADRLAAARRLRHPQAQACTLTADLLLRYAVRAAHPEAALPLRRSAGPYGKPFLPALPGFEFSLSHSGDRVICAVSDTPVGADLELPRPMRAGFAARFCTPEEQALLACHPAWFCDLWMCKEAVMKCSGFGLSLSPRDIPLSGFPEPRLTASVRGARYALKLAALPGGLRCAVCVSGETAPSVRVHPLETDSLL